MARIHVAAVAGTIAGACLGLLLAFQAGAQGHGGGARPAGGLGGANAGGLSGMRIGVDRGWPRGPEIQTPSRLPQDKAFGEKGKDASAKKADNASAAASAGGQGNANATTRTVEKSNDGATERGRSDEAPGQTGQTGLAQAVLRADEHAAVGLEEAQSHQKDRDESGDEAGSRRNSSK